MTVGEMLYYTIRLEDILLSSVSKETKDRLLANLMSELERNYNIPAFYNQEFEQKNPFVMRLYRTISEERSL